MKLQHIFLLFLIFSCVAKKNTTTTKETKDTIYKTKTIKEVERFTDTLTIKQPCDSLGNLKPFKQLIKVKQGNISLTGLNNVITAEIDLKGYKEQLEQIYKSKYQNKTEIKEVIRYKVSFTHWIVHLICVIIILILLRTSR
jgi:Trk-type K+ transport system membrane component